jgi:hypothetical protein
VPETGHPRPTSAPTGPVSPARLVAAVLILALAFAAGYAVHRPAPPVAASPAGSPSATPGHGAHDVGGLSVSDAGYTLRTPGAALVAGRTGEFTFQIVGPDQTVVTAYRTVHEKLMHLVLVRRDLSGYQHLHPQLDPDGTWRVGLRLPAAGDYRLIADFEPVGLGRGVSLGVDLPVPGAYAPEPLPAEEPTIVVDGYTLTMDAGLIPGKANQILVWLGRDGEPVNDIQPHLGAYGHLVALRQGDLAYLHVHPALASTPSSVVAFTAQVPSAGTYRLFFEFRHRDVVRTAAFTVTVS